jgi:hypothetical protein
MESEVIYKIRGRWDDSLEMYLKEFVCEGGRWVKLFRIIQSPVFEVSSF